jgi:hypothetical protein
LAETSHSTSAGPLPPTAPLPSNQGAGHAAGGSSGSRCDKDGLAEPFDGMSGAKGEGTFSL